MWNIFFHLKKCSDLVWSKINSLKEITPGVLYLIPCSLSEGVTEVIPEYVKVQVQHIDFFVVENLRTARRFLRSTGYKRNFDETVMIEMDKHTPNNVNEAFLTHLLSGKNVGLISEAGLPALADPGTHYIRMSHENNITVKPLTGPSSVTLALIASGMNGQQFRFHGYIPVRKEERTKKIMEMEKTALKENETQIFIETPYRNHSLLQEILSVCRLQTRLCLAVDLTLPSEWIKVKTIAEWKKNIPDINKRPAVFLICK